MKNTTTQTSRLLINENPLFVQPSLVMLVGLERAIILQQMHFLLGQKNSGREYGGYRWIWNTYQQWCDDHFPFWKPDNLSRHIASLEKMGLVVSAQLERADWVRTKYYRIDYEKLNQLLHESDNSAVSNTDYNPASSTDQIPGSLYRTETSTETTPETLGLGVKTLASSNTVATIPSGSTLNGAGLKANTNGNGAAPTIPTGSSNTANQQPKYGYATSSLDQLATDAGVDAATCQSLVDHLASATGLAPLVAKGKQPATGRVNKAVADLIDLQVTTVEAMKALIGLWEKAGEGWRKMKLTPEALVDFQSQKLQEIEDAKVKAKATDPDENPMIEVEEWLIGVDGKGGWWSTTMRRKRFEKQLAQGYKIRLAAT